jgi:hypothetical protein
MLQLSVVLTRGAWQLVSAARSVISLICSDFIFRSPVRGFGSLTRNRGTKETRLEEKGRRESEPSGIATGVTRVREWRDGVPRAGVERQGKESPVA